MIERRHFGPAVDSLEVLCEPANHDQAFSPPIWMHVSGLCRPCERSDGGDVWNVAFVEIADEVRQQLPFLLQLETECATDPEVVGQRTMERGHATPRGHTCASSRIRSGSGR